MKIDNEQNLVSNIDKVPVFNEQGYISNKNNILYDCRK